MCLVFGCKYMGIEFRWGAAVEVLWPMDRAVDGGEGQPEPAAVASTPGSRVQAATEGGFLGLRHKTKEADGGRRMLKLNTLIFNGCKKN